MDSVIQPLNNRGQEYKPIVSGNSHAMSPRAHLWDVTQWTRSLTSAAKCVGDPWQQGLLRVEGSPGPSPCWCSWHRSAIQWPPTNVDVGPGRFRAGPCHLRRSGDQSWGQPIGSPHLWSAPHRSGWAHFSQHHPFTASPESLGDCWPRAGRCVWSSSMRPDARVWRFQDHHQRS